MSDSDQEVVVREDMGYQVFCAKMAGLTTLEIANRYEMHPEEVIEVYSDYRVRLGQGNDIDRKEARQIEVDRLNHLQSAYYTSAMSGDIKAAELTLKIISQRINLLDLAAIDPRDKQAVQNILVVGESKKEFIEALMAGRGVADDEIIDGEEAADE